MYWFWGKIWFNGPNRPPQGVHLWPGEAGWSKTASNGRWKMEGEKKRPVSVLWRVGVEEFCCVWCVSDLMFFFCEKHSVKHLELKNQLYSLWTSGFFCVYLCLSVVDHELPANCCTTTLPLERVPKPVGGTKDEAAKPFGVYKGDNKKRWCFPILIPDFHGLGIQFIYLNPICFLTFFMFGGCHQYRAVSKSFDQVHPGRLTWNLRITHFERKMIWTKPPWLCSSR